MASGGRAVNQREGKSGILNFAQLINRSACKNSECPRFLVRHASYTRQSS